MYSVGDILIGNRSANGHYTITHEGVQVIVLDILEPDSNGNERIEVKVLNEPGEYPVLASYFDLVKPSSNVVTNVKGVRLI